MIMDREKLINISHANPIIIFDGVCMLCNSAIQYIIDHDKEGKFRYLTLQTASDLGLVDRNSLPDSIILMQNGETFVESNAILQIGKNLGSWQGIVSRFLGIFPTSVGNFVYRIIAKNRYRWFGQLDTCMIPPPQWKTKFLG
jgi:predicted DCC family thiol-disulfide oxidoreductase YuxK